MKPTILLFLFLFIAACQTPSFKSHKNHSVSVIQGLTTESTTQINVLRPKGNFEYKVSPQPVEYRTQNNTISDKNWVSETLFISKLNLKQTYTLTVFSPQGKKLTSREFHALDLNKDTVKVGLASCMDHRYLKKNSLWPDLSAQNPDLIFFLGDNIYARIGSKNKKYATPEEILKQYIITRQRIPFYFEKKLIPTLAIWDDNDFGQKDGDKTFKYKEESQNIFSAFFPQNPISHPNYKNGPGLSLSLQVANQNFLLLDNRSFRDPNYSKNGKHWGEKQESWIFDSLSSNQKFTWLVGGNQFFGGYHPKDFVETFDKSHPENHKNFIAKIAKQKTKVAFLSGDRHLFEFMKIDSPDLPYETFELTTSPIHAIVFPPAWDKYPNPRKTAGQANINNFAILKSRSLKNGGSQSEIKVFSKNKKPIFEKVQIVK